MSIPFRVGRYIDPSGFGLAVVDVPEVDAEKNISLIDYSHKWEENVASSDMSVIKSYVDGGGHMPQMTVTDFVVTNVTTSAKNDSSEVPLYYRHQCRFFHYTYGENPGRQVYITDQNGNIIKDLNYLVKVEKVITASNVYKVDVLTDFYNNESVQYKVKYNRCKEDGSDIFLGWIETLNATPYFTYGNPYAYTDQYAIYGPDANGMYAAIVPPVPTLSELVNSIGISFSNAPTIIAQDVTNNVAEYLEGVTVKYTLKATSTTTFTLQRSHDRYGNPDNFYLQSSSNPLSWAASPVNFAIGTKITALYGMNLWVYADSYLKNGDEAYFTAKKSFYYLMPTAYSAIYLKKPEHVTASDDWYMKIRAGTFRRRMDASGNPVPSGVGTLFEYSVPEWNEQLWSLKWGPPYRETLNERVELLDKNTVQLQRTPLFIDPSAVLHNPDYPGFPPTGYMYVVVNDQIVQPDQIMDWDVYNGTVKLARILTHRDDIVVSYNYEEKYYEYPGYLVSGVANVYWNTLDLNPTPSHNYGIYASGLAAHIYLSPHVNVDTLTVINDRPLYHNFTGTPSGIYDFEIGIVSVGPHCKITDVKVTDIRTRGGGLSKMGIRDLEKVKEVQPESEFFWDVGYFDGQAVPANGVLVIRIPKMVLAGNGGPFTEDEVLEKVKKHMALGEYPIIEYV